ncbi:MAG: NAD-dependent epimerase/dehydratase family protein [Bacteroidetes bacterium]|nr:NAD-dependent epimerase/dehydratase family protein [Bacteroidota bacterium]
MSVSEYYHEKRILITGGLGFLGSNLAHKLVSFGAKVTIIDNLDPLYGGNLYNIEQIRTRVKLALGDIQDESLLVPLLSDCDIVFHFAAQVSYIDSQNIPFRDLDLNARTTMSVLEIIRKHKLPVKVVFSSSRMVIGKSNDRIVDETVPTNPLSLYAIHKLTSEKYLQMYHADFGIPVIIFRITNPYGIRQQMKHNKYSLVGWFIRMAMENETITIFGDGRQLRDYIYVEDIIEAFLLSAANPDSNGQIINLGSGYSSEFGEMVNTIVEIVGSGQVKYVDWPANYERIETGNFQVDISKLKSLTGWSPSFTLEQGIRLTYEYYKSNLSYYI